MQKSPDWAKAGKTARFMAESAPAKSTLSKGPSLSKLLFVRQLLDPPPDLPFFALQ